MSGGPDDAATATLVAGASGGCGASLLAGRSLALAWAQAGAAAWLVELDLERGDLAGAGSSPGDRTIADLRPVAAELDGRPPARSRPRRTRRA